VAADAVVMLKGCLVGRGGRVGAPASRLGQLAGLLGL
jgi:hypothetical protein